MVALIADIRDPSPDQDWRLRQRRTIDLTITATSGDSHRDARVHNLSEDGLLLEADADFRVDEVITVLVPLAGLISAKVVWTRDGFYGCKFITPITRSAVSAALLSAPFKKAANQAQSDQGVQLAKREREEYVLPIGGRAKTDTRWATGLGLLFAYAVAMLQLSLGAVSGLAG